MYSVIYMSVGNSGGAQITSIVTNEATGNYGITYHGGGDNSSIAFYSAWVNGSNDIKNETVVHEFGHALGLAHTQSSNVNRSVMRQLGFNGVAAPLSDDRAGITALY